jgi:apolipoprotein N-acyltransferase
VQVGRLALDAAVVAAVVILAAVSSAAPDGGGSTGSLRVALVQGGGRRGTSQTEVPPPVVFDAQARASGALLGSAGAARPDLVVWPENVVALTGPLRGSPQAAFLSELAQSLHATVLAGVTITRSPTTYRNEVVVWGPDGSVVATYEKVHRVPFGEYVPLRGLFAHVADLSGVPRDAVAGTGNGLVRTPAGPLGLLVSFEVFFADRSIPSVQAGAELLVVPTNTSSYASGQVPAQELAAARVQAVQTGRDLVQAAPTGYSAAVDNHGRVLQRSELGVRQVLSAVVERRVGSTLYVRVGDLPLVAGSAALVAGTWLMRLGRRRGTRAKAPRPAPPTGSPQPAGAAQA